MTQLALGLDLPLDPIDPSRGWTAMNLPSPIRRAFEAIAIAEEELARAWPARVGEPPGALLVLARPTVLEHLTPDLYRAHARELVERMKRTEDTAFATRAEVLAGLYGASARAPLRSEAWAIYHRLFSELLPHLFAKLAADPDQREPAEKWVGQVEEDIAAAQRSLRDETRRLQTKRTRRTRETEGT